MELRSLLLCSSGVALPRTAPPLILLLGTTRRRRRKRSIGGGSSAASLVVSQLKSRLQQQQQQQQRQASSTASSPKLLISKDKLYAAAAAAASVCLIVAAIRFVVGKAAAGARREELQRGSVSDLIRRGQLRSGERGDARPLSYEDPFNNPLVKNMVESNNPLVRMCGKLFRLAPVTLTEEQVTRHQNRRIQAYQWRRPVIFLNEGDALPQGVDPDEVRWIPSNHPFATTSDYIDEASAQRNVYQTRGAPSRVRAEHEALRRRMQEAAKHKAPGGAEDVFPRHSSSSSIATAGTDDAEDDSSEEQDRGPG